MKASELIKYLQKGIDKEGDMDIYVLAPDFDGMGMHEAEPCLYDMHYGDGFLLQEYDGGSYNFLIQND